MAALLPEARQRPHEGLDGAPGVGLQVELEAGPVRAGLLEGLLRPGLEGLELGELVDDELGVAPGVVDGLMGPKTAGALAKFRTDKGLAAGEGLDDDVVARLRNARLDELDN